MIARAFTVALMTGISMVPASAVAADGGRVLTFRDHRITESSGLVDLGSFMVTTNDSGHRSVLFVVSQATGRTVGVTDFHAHTVDVEALASAGGRAVWAGDIGDNRARRKSISVYRVRVDRGVTDVHPSRYRLVYPRGAHDAESLFADRRGRLYLITKSLLGGTVYRAPAALSRKGVNRLQPVGRVIDYATDAAMLPDGRHLIVRGPGRASVYTFPGFHRIGGFVLPRQRQGEGVSVGPGSRIRLSSEGKASIVRQVRLPAFISRAMRPPKVKPKPGRAKPGPASAAGASPAASPSPSPAGSSSPEVASTNRSRPDLRDEPWLMWSIPGVIVLGAAGIALGLRRRSQ